MNYTFHEAAEAELNQAVDYYNSCRPNLGWEFAREVHAAIQNILAHPTAWKKSIKLWATQSSRNTLFSTCSQETSLTPTSLEPSTSATLALGF